MKDEKEVPGQKEEPDYHQPIIKPSHRGLFTKKAKKAGMSVQQYAKACLANPHQHSEETMAQARFAHTVSKWNH